MLQVVQGCCHSWASRPEHRDAVSHRVVEREPVSCEAECALERVHRDQAQASTLIKCRTCAVHVVLDHQEAAQLRRGYPSSSLRVTVPPAAKKCLAPAASRATPRARWREAAAGAAGGGRGAA
eukprot:2435984-Pyramimonas_sp.AAC.1